MMAFVIANNDGGVLSSFNITSDGFYANWIDINDLFLFMEGEDIQFEELPLLFEEMDTCMSVLNFMKDNYDDDIIISTIDINEEMLGDE